MLRKGLELIHIQMKEILEIREKIDELDIRLLQLIRERLALVEKIKAQKENQGIEFEDADREKTHIKDIQQQAKLMKLDPEKIADIFRLLIEYSKSPHK